MTTTSMPDADRANWILADVRRLPEGVVHCHQQGGLRWPEWALPTGSAVVPGSSSAPRFTDITGEHHPVTAAVRSTTPGCRL